jgi:hypothetical protein
MACRQAKAGAFPYANLISEIKLHWNTPTNYELII